MRGCVVAGILIFGACSADRRTYAADSPASPDTLSAPSAALSTPGEAIDAAIARIREHVATTERDSARYRCVTRDLDGFSAEGGELVACLDGEHLRKLKATHYGESGRATEEYYLRDGRLVFLFTRSERYTAPLSGVVAETEEHRTYWLEDRIIRWVGPDKQEKPIDSPEAESHDREVQSTVRLFTTCALDSNLAECTA